MGTRDAELRQWPDVPDAVYRRLVLAIRDYAIFLLDPDGRIKTWNEGAALIKGYSAEEAIGSHFERFYLQEDRERGHPAKVLAAALRDGRYEEEGWRRRKDGSRFWASVVVTAIHDAHGGHLGFAKVTRDLTQRREDEQRLREAKARLEIATEEQQMFIHTLSHDLRAPLRAMETLASATLRESAALDDDARQNLVALERSARQATALVEKLLSFTLAGRARLLEETLDVDAMAREVLRDLRSLDPHRAVEAIVASGPGMRARGDRGLVHTVLQNLLSNAWKYTRPRERARIVVEPAGEEAGMRVFRVSDNGVGFDPARAPRLFEPFTRLHGGDFEGAGLGLASARRAIERHGGRVWAEAEAGRGATFYFTLPAP